MSRRFAQSSAPSSSASIARFRSAPERAGASSLRADSVGNVYLDDAPIDATQLRAILRLHGINPPKPTGATYDTTTEHRTGLRFHLTPKWITAAAATFIAVSTAIGVIVLAARSIAANFHNGHDDALGSNMAAIVCAVVYGTAVLVVYGYAIREKYQHVNRLDPRTWIRELHRVRKLAQRAPTDAETEDAALDRMTSSHAHALHHAPAR